MIMDSKLAFILFLIKMFILIEMIIQEFFTKSLEEEDDDYIESLNSSLVNIHDGTESDHLLDKNDSDNENNNAVAQFNIAEAQVHL